MTSLEKQRLELQVALTKDICRDKCIALINTYKINAERLNNESHKAYADYFLSNVYACKGQINRSTNLLKKIIPFFNTHQNLDFLHASYVSLGRNKAKQGNIEKALEYIELSTKLEIDSNDTILSSINVIVEFLTKLGQYDIAIVKCKESLSKLSLTNELDRKPYFEILLLIATIYIHKKKPSKTLEIIQKIDAAQKIHQFGGVTTLVNQSYGVYYDFIGNYKKAVSYFKNAITDSKAKKMYPLLLTSTLYLSDMYIKEEKLSKAEKVLMEAFNAYKSEGKDCYLKLLSNLVTVYQLQGNKLEQTRFETELNINSY